MKLQASSHWTRFAATPRTCSSWYAAHAVPAFFSSLSTLLIEQPTMRSIERIDEPSQSRVRIWARLASGSLFILRIYELLCFASSILCKQEDIFPCIIAETVYF